MRNTRWLTARQRQPNNRHIMKETSSSTVQTETRRLAAIMFTDIVGFSRQMGTDEARTLRLLETHNQIIQQAVTEYYGTVIKTVGDAFLVDFPSVVHAGQCAQHIHAQFRTHNAGKGQNEQIHVRIGIHLGAHLNLAAIYSELGKESEAHAEAAEVMRINPNFSLEVHKQRAPIKDPAMMERHITALRKAGLR